MNDDELNQEIEEYLTDKFCSKDSEVFKDECVLGIRSRCSEFETIKKLLFDFIKLEYKRLGIEFFQIEEISIEGLKKKAYQDELEKRRLCKWMGIK